MKSRIYFASCILLLSLIVVPVRAAYTSFYVFGDCISTATANSVIGSGYYGDRWSNGRTWVEMLAQQQGLLSNFTNNNFANNVSYWGNTSGDLVGEVNSFTAPTNPGSALVVIWVNNADLYFPTTDNSPTLAKFTTVINQAQTNHYKAITNLYAKGIRTLIMPNVVDISTIPACNKDTANTNLYHQASVNYNTAFNATLNRARINCPGLTIFVPDYYTLLKDMIAHSANYGLTNALQYGLSIDALTALGTGTSLTSGPGTNYIFWDSLDPSAKVHYIMANVAQQMISPVHISQIVLQGASNRLDVVNMPVGMTGAVEGSTNMNAWTWTSAASFTATNPAQSLLVQSTFQAQGSSQIPFRPNGQDPSGPPMPGGGGGGGTNSAPEPTMQLYRLRLPYAWVWP